MHGVRKQFIACESSERLRHAFHQLVRTSIAQFYKSVDVLYKGNLSDRWFGSRTVIGLEHKLVFFKHSCTYVRVHPFHLVPYPETYQNSSEDGKIKLNTSQKRPDESPKVPISEDDDIDEDLEALNNNVDRPAEQNSTLKKIELLKPGQIIKCELANNTDSKWRKLNVISKANKATGKNKNLMGWL